ncbi:oxygen-independent coproporphyrinogen III oxidase [Maricaulis sp. D1M11]|uniref:oxygen-independent coproporphyrinogen III oxidase n=1 Tax=Maricaulis sp. D1M11 TaxID=3076117 RepID=UPI0039B6DBF6
MLDPVLLRHAKTNTPRYTSFPTAPHFSDLTPDTYAHWLADIPDDDAISLYLHIPYCRDMCWYCGCSTRATRNTAPLERYADLLEQEIRRVANHVGRRQPVAHLHWGGGTPTYLPQPRLEALSALLEAHFNILPDAERAIEIDPRVCDETLVDSLAATGINRASLGVQSFAPHVQKAINRVQDFETTQTCAKRLRERGIQSLSLDLLYGLPRQTLTDCRDTVLQALELDPDRLSVFGYAHVPQIRKHQNLIQADDLPSAEARIEQAWLIAKTLENAGYVAIGIDHYARADDDMAIQLREGRLNRNFQGYTTDRAQTLIGLGASAIGRLPRGFVQNTPDVATWSRAIEQGQLATARGHALDQDDECRAAIIERLMCDLEADLPALRARFGELPEADLDDLVADGIVQIDESAIRISPDYRMLARNVAARFDNRLGQGPARHSRSV